MSLRSRLLLYFILVAILPILLIGIVSYEISSNVINNMAIDSSEKMIDRVSSEIDGLFQEVYNLSNLISDDPSIQQILRKPMDQDVAQRFSTDLLMDTRLRYIQDYKSQFFGFYIIAANGGKYKSNYRSIKSFDLREEKWYRDVIDNRKPVWFGPHPGSQTVETSGQTLISAVFPIIDKATGNTSGVVLIDVEESLLTNIVKSRLAKTGYMFIMDKDNNVISNPNAPLGNRNIDIIETATQNISQYEKAFTKEKNGEKPFVINKNHLLTVYKESKYTAWKLVGVTPTSELKKDSNIIGIVIALTLLMICIFAFITAFYTAGSIVNPIRKMMLLMKKVEEGDLAVTMNVQYADEVGQLGRSFNVMVEKIRNLMEKVYQEQKELRKAELKALQAQINPHFLYNTLDSIIWLAREMRNDDIIKMVTALTRLFRIGISRGKDIISIKEEIDHVDSYLTIQNIRYKSKFSYNIQVEESAYRYKTLKLILQPIVENAIYHGIKMKRETGKIGILVRSDEDSIILEVVDTGIGMTKEQLKALENTLKNGNGEKMDSYGVINVDERIKIFFGPDYGLTFYSEYGKGTKVEIKIPKVLEVEDNVKGGLG